VVSFTPLPLYFPGKEYPEPAGEEAGWASEPVREKRRKKMLLLGTKLRPFVHLASS
jgi:hypothetical protein